MEAAGGIITVVVGDMCYSITYRLQNNRQDRHLTPSRLISHLRWKFVCFAADFLETSANSQNEYNSLCIRIGTPNT